MLKPVYAAAISVGIAAVIGGAIMTVFLMKGFVCGEPDRAEAFLAWNRAEVHRQVFQDLEKYGVDIYRMYQEVSQATPGRPGSDFSVDKTIRKLGLTYPDSNIRRLADAHMAYNAIRNRDMLQIEKYLSELEESNRTSQLMPNGYEIVPQLIAAQYNYLFHVGRFSEATKMLDYLEGKFGDSYLFQPQGKSIAVCEFIAHERRVLEIIKRKGEM